MVGYSNFSDGGKPIDQDKLILTLLNDEDFLKQLVRRELDPILFTGIYRQRVVEFALWFFDRYRRAPRDNVVEIFDTAGNGFRPIAEDDVDGFEAYLERLAGIDFDISEKDYLLERLNEFLYRRTLLTHSSLLQQDLQQIDRRPERLEDILRETVDRIDRIKQIDTKISSILDDDWEEFTRPLTRFNIPSIDAALGGGFRAPNLGVVQAYTGRGKTWAAAHLAKMATRFGHNALVIINEMHGAVFKLRTRMSILGCSAEDLITNKISYKECRERINRAMIMGSKIYVHDDSDKSLRASDIPGLVENYEDQIGKPIDVIIIDSADDLLPPDMSQQRIIRRESDSTSPTYSYLRGYTQSKMKLVITTTQSQRRGEKLLWLKSGTVGDDINKSRRATIGVSINAFDSELAAGYHRLLLYKNTHGPADISCWCRHKYGIGQFVTEAGEVKGYNLTEYQRRLERDGGFLGEKKPGDETEM